MVLESLKLAHLIHMNELLEIVSHVDRQRKAVRVVAIALRVVVEHIPNGDTSFEYPSSNTNGTNNTRTELRTRNLRSVANT